MISWFDPVEFDKEILILPVTVGRTRKNEKIKIKHKKSQKTQKTKKSHKTQKNKQKKN